MTDDMAHLKKFLRSRTYTTVGTKIPLPYKGVNVQTTCVYHSSDWNAVADVCEREHIDLCSSKVNFSLGDGMFCLHERGLHCFGTAFTAVGASHAVGTCF